MKEGDLSASIDVAIDDLAWRESLAEPEETCRRAVLAALVGRVGRAEVEVSVLLTNDDHMAELNQTYRQKSKSTNVLSFPNSGPSVPCGTAEVLGDVVLAHETVVGEADAQGKTISDHATHLLVHGTLHLLGLDHQTDDEAQVMEDAEVCALKDLGIVDPYGKRGKPHER